MGTFALPLKRLAKFVAAFALLALSMTTDSLAHVLDDTARGAPSFGWSAEPWVVALMAASLAAYVVGHARLLRRGARRIESARLRRAHLLAFVAGWTALALAFFSPLDALGSALFSAHMVQHETMMLVAAPLCVMGRPLGVWIWALPHRARLRVGQWIRARAFVRFWHMLTMPVTAWVLHAAALWAWHAPALFEAALMHPWVHTLQHASFLLTALLFWWSITGEGARRQTDGHAMLSLFTTMVHTGALGALITLAPQLWYPLYVEPCSALGVDPLHDQQLGGLIMWVPATVAYLAGALAIAARWLMRSDAPVLTARHAVIVRRDGVR
ncbi:cytochrome c oxidase assembly protein [Paraburkholderia diazotrophica]|uniref:cytochrome c oxidase assembly protein n=1 Tax=Paraburkholderia diazotrophica TaxID=667676 RepID=UPI003D1722BA